MNLRLSILAFLMALLGTRAFAQGPVLIQEVISREVGLFVGDGPNNQVISREVGIFVGDGPNNQVISREYSLNMVDAAAPPIVTAIAMTVSPSGHTVTLDWSSYNQWAVRDVDHYAVYFASSAFTNVTAMTPYLIVPGEQLTLTLSGLPEWQDHFFAVVPVDGLGNFNPAVQYRAAYVLMPQVISREVGLFVGDGPNNQVISREYSINASDAAAPPIVTSVNMTVSPSGHTVSLDWSSYNQFAVRDVDHYAIYYSPTGPFTNVTGIELKRIVPGESFTTTFTNLVEWQDHYFAVVPVDGLGNFNPNILYRAAYVLMPQVISREVGLFVGDGPNNQVVSREVSLVVGGTNVPDAVTYSTSPFAAVASKTRYGGIDLDWSFYNEWAQRDVVRYHIYVTNTFFNSVVGMPVYATSANGTQKDTIINLACEQIHYVAVVAEDALGNFNPVVYPTSSKASVCQLGEVANVTAEPDYYSVALAWDLGGVGTDLANFVHHFLIYVNGETPPLMVGPDRRSWVVRNLLLPVDHTFRITTVDNDNLESAGVTVHATPRVIPGATGIARFWDAQAGDGGMRTDGDGTWSEGGGSWNDGAGNVSWSSTPPAFAVFGAGGSGAGDVAVSGLVSGSGIAFIPGKEYTLNGGEIVLAGSPVLHVADGVTGVLAGLIGGTSGFAKTGTGTLRLSSSAVNTYSGEVRVEEGALELGGAATGDQCIRGNLVVAGGELRSLTNNRIANTSLITVDADAIWEKSTSAESIGGLTGNGTVTSSSTLAMDCITGETHIFSGALQGGPLLVRGNNVNGSSARQVFQGNMNLEASNIQVAQGNSADDNVVMELSGYGSTKTEGWLLAGEAGAGTATLELKDNHVLRLGTLSGGNTTGKSGAVLQSGGELYVQNAVFLGNWGGETSTYTLSHGAVALTGAPEGVPNAPSTTVEPGILYLGIAGTGVFIQSGGIVTLHGLVMDGWGETAGDDTYTLIGGTLELGPTGIVSGNLNANTTYKLNFGGGVVASSASWETAKTITLTGEGGRTTFNASQPSHVITLLGTLIGPGGLAKGGPGEVRITGANTYEGGTVVTQGVLRVSGTITHPGQDVDIQSGGTLHLQSGSLTAATTRIRADGTLSGCGIINGQVINDGALAIDCVEGLTVNGTVTNNGRMRFIGGTRLLGASSVVNNGILDLITGNQTLPANLVNNGTVLLSGSVQAVEASEQGGVFSVSIASQPGHAYQLQRAESLPGTLWTDIGPAQEGTGAELDFTDPNPGAAGRRYYRFKVEP